MPHLDVLLHYELAAFSLGNVCDLPLCYTFIYVQQSLFLLRKQFD